MAGSFAGTTLRYGRRGLAGTRATQISLVEGRLTELQRTGEFVFIREHGAAPFETSAMAQAERADRGGAVLVRPDGYIGWAGASARQWDREWVGSPAHIARGAIAAPRVAAG